MSSVHKVLHNGDLRWWLGEHRRCSRSAREDLALILEGQTPQDIARLKPEVVFLKHPQHMNALIQAGFDFTTMSVLQVSDWESLSKFDDARMGSYPTRPSQNGEEVRRFALYLNAQESVHLMLDALGVPPVPEKEASRWIADVMRNDWTNSLRHLHRVYPHHVERWAGKDRTLSMMAVNAWTERPSKRNDAMLVDVITWGMDVEAFRSVVRDLAPKRVGTFERLVSLARAKTLEASEQLTCIPSASRAARL